MSRVLTATGIGSLALATIGAFTVNDTAPDPIHLQRTMQFLDMLLAETVGTRRMFHRIEPGVLSLAITNGTQSYNLYTALGASLPADGIQFVVAAWCEDQDARRWPVEIVNQQKFETVCEPDKTGPPEWMHLDATADPTLRIYPIPDSSDTNTYTLKLQVQKYAPDVAPGGITGTMPLTSVMHDFGQTWQRWMVFSWRTISAPVRSIPSSATGWTGSRASPRTRRCGSRRTPTAPRKPQIRSASPGSEAIGSSE